MRRGMLAAILAAFAVAGTASAGVINGDFENGLTGWDSDHSGIVQPAPYGGHWVEFHSATGQQDSGTLVQAITVNSLSRFDADYSYRFNVADGGFAGGGFWLYGPRGTAQLNIATNDSGLAETLSAPHERYTTYLTPGTYVFAAGYSAAPANATAIPTAQWDATFTLDNVRLTAVPEPSGLALLLLGMACVYGFRRTK